MERMKVIHVFKLTIGCQLFTFSVSYSFTFLMQLFSIFNGTKEKDKKWLD